MASGDTGHGFNIWGEDHAVYGPVELPLLVDWVKEQRVTADTWIFPEDDNTWRKAAQLPELQMFFRAQALPSAPDAPPTNNLTVCGIKPGSLRRMKILADLDEPQLERFVQFMEVHQLRQWAEIVKQGDNGDAMYLILDGELRVRMMIGGKETILTTLSIGEFFGEISLFDHGPRSADVIANKDSTLLKISGDAFEKLIREAPELAAPFLFAIGKTLAARIRADNKRFGDSLAFARAAGH
ncbi:MAG: cyclic nucleotide-binding domain-containing protein [Verrucomicrobia bacterium]|nr:cyclic nucleotide-binding domain-containing protein [Verrucomicrobiota bacterium]